MSKIEITGNGNKTSLLFDSANSKIGSKTSSSTTTSTPAVEAPAAAPAPVAETPAPVAETPAAPVQTYDPLASPGVYQLSATNPIDQTATTGQWDTSNNKFKMINPLGDGQDIEFDFDVSMQNPLDISITSVTLPGQLALAGAIDLIRVTANWVDNKITLELAFYSEVLKTFGAASGWSDELSPTSIVYENPQPFSG